MSLTAEEIKAVIAAKVEGKITPEHDPEGHHYRLFTTGSLNVKLKTEGVLVDSVTTILGSLDKPHLKRWIVKMGIEWLERDDRWQRLKDPSLRAEYLQGAQEAHTDVRDDAGSVGSLAHAVIERYIKDWLAKGQPLSDIRQLFQEGADTRAIAAARAFERLAFDKQVVPLASEILVGDARYSAGTLDFLCLMEGQLTLGDFKTSNSIDQIGYPMQVVAYAKFLEYMTGLKVKQIKIFHLSKDSDRFTVYKVTRFAEIYAAFKGLAKCYQYIQKPREQYIIKDLKRITL